ncbi:Hypothetical protein CAP_5719 [Chondromyces apiculatus DSM 436]|uniref:PEGA domain-containing protein n=2 Tax=Chondromyces apiculatus TaxID=51 RepID=A0A017T2Z0_9BACT|nr:Hypothetical protein CAP_5719 [Chondromyces apiculatus DSM 436]
MALVTTVAAPSWAIDSDAQAFFAQGRQLRGEGRCTDAILAFRRAFDLYPQGLGALRNIAECEEELGQFASARVSWWSLRRAALQSNEPKYEGWETDAESAYKRLESKVARLTVHLKGEGQAQAELNIDGRPLDPRLLGVEIERDVGPHQLTLTYGGAAPVVRHIELTAGEREAVTLDIPRPVAVTQTPTVKKPGGDEDEPAKGSKAMRIAGIAAMSVGGASAVGAVVSVLLRNAALGEIEETCPDYQGCNPSLESTESRGRTAATLVNVFGAVAIVGVGVGVPLFVLGSRSSSPSAPSAPSSPKSPKAASSLPQLRVGVGPIGGGWAAQIGGKF